MELSRRRLIQAAPIAVAGLALTERKSFANTIVPPPPIPTAVLAAYRNGQNNLASKMYGSGASAADFRQASTSLGTFFGTLEGNGSYARMDAAIKSQSSAISSFDPSTANPSTLLAQIQPIIPSIQIPAVQSALAAIDSSAVQTLISNGTGPSISQYISLLQTVEASIGSGLVTVKYGIRKDNGLPSLRRVGFCGPALVAGVLALGAVFAPEVELGVLFGVAISFSDYLLIGSALYAISAALSC